MTGVEDETYHKMLQELIINFEAYSQKDRTYSVAELTWDEYEAIANRNISKSRISFFKNKLWQHVRSRS